MTSLANRIRALIRDVPDFPKKGIVFKDITPVLRDGPAFGRVVAAMEAYAVERGADLIAGIEARGFIFGAALAARMNRGFIPVRKKGKLPWDTVSQTYALEYGKDTVEVHKDAVEKGRRVLVVDDVLATGGTMAATCKLVEKAGGVVAGCAFLIELSFLKGRSRIKGRRILSLVKY
jgi:adenine phosphoribosyltransferase